MLSKSLIQFSVGGWGCVPSLFFDLRPDYGGGNEDNGSLFKRSHVHTATLSAFNPAAGHHQPTPLPETPEHSWASLGQSPVGSLLLSPGSWCIQGFVCALQESVSPVLCKSWQLYGGVNGDLLQEGLCYTLVCCTQSPSEPLRQATDPYLRGRSQVDLWKYHYKKASGGDGIPVELFQILKDDAVKVLHSICQQIWETQQWPWNWKRSVFILITKKGNAKDAQTTVQLHSSHTLVK